jgi:Asp-tRNA(Asn)/Glu-tRNA(Gln) amidotransferase C subunit
MALRMPTPDDLQRLASENHFELSEEELTSFQEVIPDLFGSYEKLERMPPSPRSHQVPGQGPGSPSVKTGRPLSTP